MEQILTHYADQFPMLGAVFIAAYFITRYIAQGQKENNLRYDTLDKEFKTDMKEANKTLVELTTRSIVALEKSIEVSELVQQKMDRLVNNQASIIHQTDKIK
jgi:DNA replication protein DnaD